MRLDRLKLPRSLSCVFALGFLAATAGPAAAQTATWTATGTTFNWNDINNWSTGVVPNDTATTAAFTGNRPGTVLLGGAAFNVGALNFSAGGYTLGNGASTADQLTLNITPGVNLTNSAGSNTINARLVAAALNGSITGGSLTLANTASGASANSLTGTITVGAGGTLTAGFAGTVGAGNFGAPSAVVTGSNSLGNAAVVLNGGTLNLRGQLVGVTQADNSVVGGGLTGQFYDIARPGQTTTLINNDGFTAFGTGNADFFVKNPFTPLNNDLSGGTTDRSRANAFFNQLTPKTLGDATAAATVGATVVNAGRTSSLTPPADPNFATFFNGGLNFQNTRTYTVGANTINGNLFGQPANAAIQTNPLPPDTNYMNVGQYTQTNSMARFTGLLHISPTGGGNYWFDTQSDDGSIIYIDGKLLVYNNLDQGEAGFGLGRFGPVSFTAGNPTVHGVINLASNSTHVIDVYYYQGGGGAALVVNYNQGPDAGGFNQGIGSGGSIPNIAFQGFQAQVALGNNITINAGTNNTINVTQAYEADMGTLTFNAGGTLTSGTATSVGNALLRFSGTTLAPTTGGNYTIVAQGNNDVALGTITSTVASGNNAAIIKQGQQNLILDGGNATQPAGSGLSYEIQNGRLESVTQITAANNNTNPLGSGNIVTLNSTDGTGTLQIRTRGATATATQNNRINVNTNTTGAIEVVSNNAVGLTVQLGVAGGTALSLQSGSTLTIDTYTGMTLQLLGDLIGSGTIFKGDNPNSGTAGVNAGTVPGNTIGGVVGGTLAAALTPPLHNGTGALTLTGATNTFTGTLVINTGTVNAPSGALFGATGSIVVDGPVFYASLNAAGTGNQNTNQPAGGTLTLTAANTTYSGAPLTYKGGTLNNTGGGTNTITEGIILGGLSTGVPVGSASVIITGNNFLNMTTTGFSEAAGSGPQFIDKQGNVTLSLNVASVLSDGAIFSNEQNVVNLNNATALGTRTQVNVNNNLATTINVNASAQFGSLNGVGTVNLGTNTLTLGGSTAIPNGSFNGVINGTAAAGANAIIKTGSGTQVFGGANTYSGVTRVDAGVLQVNSTSSGPGAPSGLGTSVVQLNNGTLRLGASPVPSTPIAATGYNFDVIRALSDPNPVIGGTGPFAMGTNHSVDQSFSSTSGFIFYEQGALAPNVTGAPANTLTASPLGLPSSRTLASIVNPSVTFQLQPYTGNNSLIIEQTATNPPPPPDRSTGMLTLTTPASFRSISVLDVAGSGAGTFNVIVNFVGGTSTQYGTNVTAPDWFNNTPFVAAGFDRENRANGNIDNNNTNPRFYEFDFTLNAADQLKQVQSMTFTKTSTGTGNSQIINIFGISGASTTTPAANYNNNVVALSGTTSTISVGNPNTSVQNVTITGSPTATTLNVNGDAFLSANTDYTFTVASLTVAGTTTLGVGPNPNTGNGTVVVTGAVNDGGLAANFTKANTGALTLSAAGTVTNPNTVVNVTGGTLNLNGVGALGTTTNVAVSAGATLALGAAQTLGGLGGAGAVNLNAQTLTVGSTNNLSTLFSGVIANGSGAGSLIKAGAGTLTLSGANTYTGGTTVNAGRLQANTAVSGTNSATGTGAVTIAGGAVLGGTGAVGGTAGAVTLSPGATLNPGATNAGTLTALGNVSFAGGAGGGSNSNWVVGINSAASGNAANILALTNAAGLLNLVAGAGTPINIDFEAVGAPVFVQNVPVTYTIATVAANGNLQLNGSSFPTTATTSGFTFSSSTINFGTGTASLMASGSGTSLLLTFTPVPEPSTVLAVCGIGGLGLAAWRRRRAGAAQV